MAHDPWLSPKRPGDRALLVVGCMNFGTRTPEAESVAIVRRALERGVTHFDTANMYGAGASERIVGKALADVPEARIATKTGLFQLRGKFEGLAPERVRVSVAESLERLGRDSVELLYLHAPDRAVPVEETLGAVKELVAAGKVRHFAVSNYGAWEVLEIVQICDRIGLERPRVSQVLMNLAIRQVEIEWMKFAAKYGVHTTVYNPLAGGLFARPLSLGDKPPPGSRFASNERYQRRYWSERMFRFTEALREAAAEAGVSLVDVAYGWLARHPGVDSILAGPASVSHLDAAVDAIAKEAPEPLWARVSELQRAFDGTDASYAR